MATVPRSRAARRLATLGFVVLLTAIPAAAVGQDEYVPNRETGIPGALLPDELKLWKYDKESGQYQVVEGDATQPYVPNIRPAPKRYKIGFAEGWAAIPFSAAINKGIYRIADELGYRDHLLRQGVRRREGGDLRRAAHAADARLRHRLELAVGRGPEASWTIFDAAQDPGGQHRRRAPERHLPRRRQLDQRDIGGKAAGEYAKWLGRCGDVWILLGVNPGEGDGRERAPGRLHRRRPGGLRGDPAPSASPRDLRRPADDRAGAHQGDRLADGASAGRLRARHLDRRCAQRRRRQGADRRAAATACAVGLGCDDIGIAATRGPVEEDHFLGCVAYFPEKYPDYVMSIAADVLEGKPVPARGPPRARLPRRRRRSTRSIRRRAPSRRGRTRTAQAVTARWRRCSS